MAPWTDVDVEPAPEEPGFKYAALIFSPRPAPKGPRKMSCGKETFEANILSLVPEGEHERWRKSLGTLAWRHLEHAGRIVVVRAPASAPALNGDEQSLMAIVGTAWTAFLLCCEEHGVAPAWIVTGKASGDASGASLLNLKSAQQQIPAIHESYRNRLPYRKMEVAAAKKRWEEHQTQDDDSWFLKWIEIDGLISTPMPRILTYALLAFRNARSTPFLEFSIPGFIRSAEGVLALPRNKNSKELFKQRVPQLVPTLGADKYVGADLENLVADLWELRNECVHGKVPFEELKAQGERGLERAGQLEYVAEAIAREALLVALRMPDPSIFESRDALETAWDEQKFPPKP